MKTRRIFKTRSHAPAQKRERRTLVRVPICQLEAWGIDFSRFYKPIKKPNVTWF